MSAIVYKFRHGFHPTGVPAQVIGERIAALKKRRASPENPEGSVTSEDVLSDATDPDSPLHPCFPWDDAEAAREHRLLIAHRLITCYDIYIIQADREPIVVSPANVSVPSKSSENGREFVPSAYAMSDEERKAHVLNECIALIKGLQKRFAGLKGITPQIVALLDQVTRLIERERDKKPKGRK